MKMNIQPLLRPGVLVLLSVKNAQQTLFSQSMKSQIFSNLHCVCWTSNMRDSTAIPTVWRYAHLHIAQIATITPINHTLC
ncbi:hypothetical protein DL89DRAFT_159976 [Linderina pennispora]|uniref:Uncharacterized protein n=1 Tax=Linderina pennispora TaxID=61395 RepID=A0A1Y1VTX9_9FUNG|nr:uncharacterized protein DL89DRAFT_159976 [Linderina pennispora]ORX64740.1 hypothetical protein DL89DRAFT_159976 [Linderina pennispora]